MITKTFNNGGWIYVDTDTAKGWHHCSSADEFFAYRPEYKGEFDSEPVKWVGARIPKDLFGECLALIKAFPDTEVNIILLYNQTKKEWKVKVPQQTGYGASVSYNDTEENPKGWYFFGTIHSHPNMGAFWSGTDLADQAKKPGIHIVVGTEHGVTKQILCSLFLSGQRYDQTDVIEMPDLENLPETNKEWVEKIKNSPVVKHEVELYKAPKVFEAKKHLSEHFDYFLEDMEDLEKAHAIIEALYEIGQEEVADYVASKILPEMDSYASDASDAELWKYEEDGTPYYESDGKEFGL